MTLSSSSDAKRQDLDEALASFLEALGDEQFRTFRISPSDFPQVPLTTWWELTNRGWLEEVCMNYEMYRLTPLGYATALKISGRSDGPQFREKLGSLCKVLKDCLMGRTDFALIPFKELVADSGVSEAFASNALDADLIRHVLGRIGTAWDGEHLVKVPDDFGLPV